jgi:hypothetical protein
MRQLQARFEKDQRMIFITLDIIMTASHHPSTGINLNISFRPRGSEINV